MTTTSILLLFFCIAFATACNTNTFRAGARAFSRCQVLKPNFDVYWNIEGEEIVLALHLRDTPGVWLGLGISVNGGMKGADIAVAQLINGSYTLEDRYSTLYAQPVIDDEQNLRLLDQFVDPNNTVIVYSRRLVPCDIKQDVPILADGTQIIFAFGSRATIAYHGNLNRGTTTIWFHYENIVPELPSDARSFELVTPAYQVPDKDTTYTCSSHALPKDQKYHIVRWRPVLGGAYIHHMAVFGCLINPNTPTPYECPMNPGICSDLMFAWSLGQPGQDWMGEYALPIGSNFAYAVMQIHYNNPSRTAGIIDTSGFLVTYTAQLRPRDMASLAISYTIASVFIPARAPAVKYIAECPLECTNRKIPPTGINVIYWFPHMHQVGQKMWLQHIRSGVELPEISRDDHYDFGKQQTYPVNVTVLPGDTLRIHCEYNATLKDADTTGGESTQQEMCVGMIQYFPAVPFFPRCRRDFYPTPEAGANCGDPRVNGTFPTYPTTPFNYTALPPPVSPCVPEAPCDVTFTQVKTGGWNAGAGQQVTQWSVTVTPGDRPLYAAQIELTTTAPPPEVWLIDAVSGSPNVYTIPAWRYINGVIPANSNFVTFGYTINSVNAASFKLKNKACVPKASCPLSITPSLTNSWISAGNTYQEFRLIVNNLGTTPIANVKLQFNFYGGSYLSGSYNLAPYSSIATETSKNFTCNLFNVAPGQQNSNCGYFLVIPSILAVNLAVSVAQAICL